MTKMLWCNGALVTYEQAGLDDSGWPTGTGIFETIRTVSGSPWHFSRHMRRALNTARRSDAVIRSEDEIRLAVTSVVAANPFAIGRLRLLFASDGRFFATHDEYFDIDHPAKLMIFNQRFNNSKIVEKRFPYDFNLSLLALAKSLDFDDGILINNQGNISESSISNLILEIDGQWVTPPLSDGVLPGVIRAITIEKLGIRVRSIGQDELRLTQAALLLSSLKIAQPISHIEGRELANFPASEQMRILIEATALATSVG